MRGPAVAALACLACSAGAVDARAQATPVGLDPPVARQGTALLLDADASVLSPGGRAADAITIALPRGMRVDPAARESFCGRDEALACPPASRIGFGRFIVTVRDFASWGGEAEVVWTIDAALGRPLRRGDIASVVLTSKLLGIDSVTTFLGPALGTVPTTVTAFGRVVPRPAGVELRFDKLPVEPAVTAPATATPTRLELTLTAVRRVRQNFVRRIRVRTPTGYEVRKMKDHRLVGHHLLRTPRSCSGSWSSQLRVGFAGGVRRTAGRIPCSPPIVLP